MSKSNKTYIIIPEYGLDAKGKPIDLVAEVWQDDGRWVVGERSTNGNVIYYHGSYPSLESVASEYNTTPAKLRQQTKRIEAERAAQAAKGKHTPGPWFRNIRAGGHYPVIYAGPKGDHVHVATACQMATPEETEANIDLIAAAPEMLEALKAALATLKSAGIQKDVRQQCEAVIASAEGRAS